MMFYVLPAAAMAFGFSLSVATCAVLLPALRRRQFAQHAYEDAPKTHQVKSGTPTMGGIAFVVALLPLLFVKQGFSRELFWLVTACAFVGFIDDISAIVRGRNMGLRARTKFLLTAAAAAVFLYFVNVDTILVVGHFTLTVPHWFFMLLGIAAVTGTVHGVNLSDGLDGLACGSVVPPLLAFAFFALQYDAFHIAVAASLGAGACLGFLVYNRYPAKLFMGDTGSLALGALLAGVAILSGEMLLLILVGGVFVAEALSVMLQVTYFKLTHGKRIFKMSPLHHHFELSGWPETKVTTRFWLASLVLSGIGVAVVR